MKDTNDDGFEIVKDDFETVLKKFGAKSTTSNDFLLKGVQNIRKQCFTKTIVNMIWKQKDPAKIIKNKRFIHTQETFLPRTC